MKSLIKIGILIAFIFNITMARQHSPRDMADVVGRALNVSGGSGWVAKLGHIALYNSGRKNVLEVSNKYPAIHTNSLASITKKRDYWGARYGRGSRSQHYRVLSAGYKQKHYSPHYTFSPHYREGKWEKQWRYNPRARHGHQWYKKWVKASAKFRCDTFVNYCYKKGTGRALKSERTYWWQDIYRIRPRSIFKSLPRHR